MTDGSDSRRGWGTRVSQTRIGVVHQGELILPAAGSETEADQVLEDSRAVIQYYFPVEIEVRAAPDAPDTEAIVQETLRRLERSLRAV